jgi:tetratricopeptide (TPR) repeat protein
MVRRLDEIRMTRDVPDLRRSIGEVDAAFEAAFRDYGIDVPALNPDEAAGRVNRRSVRAALVAALDYWGQRCLSNAPLAARGRHLLAVAGAADPDPWRDRLRAALLAQDNATLAALAAEALTADLPATTLVVLGTVLTGHAVRRPNVVRADYPHRPTGIAVLREAARRSPADFWANFQLTTALHRSNRPAESVPSFTVAVALRPDLPVVRRQLALAYQASCDLPAALRVDREGVAADPRDVAARLTLARSLQVCGEVEQAATELREALRLDPNSGAVLRMIPHTRYRTGE